jgi:RNA-binding protein
MHTSFKQALKAQAHHLKPVILLGAKGLTPAVIAETDSALLIHELIKVKINGAEKADRQLMAAELCTALTASLVQLIGNTAIIYRKNEEDCVPVVAPSRPARETHHTGKSARRPVHSRNRSEDIKNSSRK